MVIGCGQTIHGSLQRGPRRLLERLLGKSYARAASAGFKVVEGRATPASRADGLGEPLDLAGPTVLQRLAGGMVFSRAGAYRSSLEQGKPLVLNIRLSKVFALLCAGLLAACAQPGPAGPRCEGPALRFEALAPGLWRVPPAGLETDAASRGQVHNLLLASAGSSLWLVGTGPSPAFARALQCQAQARLGLPLSAAMNPLAKSELVLGNQGLRGVSLWAPAVVAQAMRQQCAGCEERLRARLGPAAVDLGPAPVQLPPYWLTGSQGRWGPFEWRLLQRGPESTSSFWIWTGPGETQLIASFGLLGSEQVPPDVSDTSILLLADGIAQLLQAAGDAPALWLPDHGPLLERRQVLAQQAYWQALWRAARQGVAAGHTALQAPAPSADAPLPAWWQHPRHGLNWQRAWRQAEDAELMMR